MSGDGNYQGIKDDAWIARRLVELEESRKRRGGTERSGSWHIGADGKGQCGIRYTEPCFGFMPPWPDPRDPFLKFICSVCRSHQPVAQLTLFGD